MNNLVSSTMSSYPSDSMTNPRYTYHLDKLSCVRDVWFVHVTFAYLTVLSGLGCLATRWVYKWMHVYFGRLYIIFMLWCIVTSLLAHNSGLPIAVLVSFLWVVGGLTVGWVVIKLHQLQMEGRVAAVMDRELGDLRRIQREVKFREMVEAARMEVIHNRSFSERMLSYKALHGALMFMSFINLFGRLFASNQSGDFTCHTFPYYKQIDTPKFQGADQPLTPVPLHDPHYEKLPWAHGIVWWGLELSVGPLLFAFAVGSCVAWGGSMQEKVKKRDQTDVAGVRLSIEPNL